MKRIVILAIAVFAFSAIVSGREKPVTFDQLPAAAKTYINTNFSGDKVVLAIVDDDLIRPDYEVRLSSGVELKFNNSGALEKVASRERISSALIPKTIREYVAVHYPSAGYRQLEIGRRTYEVTLTNGLELTFNSFFQVVEVDD